MKLFAVLKKDESGQQMVKAVIESVDTPHEMSTFHSIVQVHGKKKADRIVGCKYINGEFVREETLAKRARVKKLASAKIKRLVWCYHDFSFGNSLAHLSRESVRWLQKTGVPIRIFPWDLNSKPPINAKIATPEDLKESAVIVTDRVPVPRSVFKSIREAPFIAGYYMLEGTKARGSEVDRLDGYDAVFTPSEFCKMALVNAGMSTPVHVWGHGFDHEMLPYTEKKPDKPFTFLWFGDENRRKGYDLFLEAFSKLENQNVRAWVRGPGSGNVAKVRARYEGDKRIVWDTKVTPPETLKDMFSEADVIVSPFRGEGFNLCMLEAMATGRAAIATRWSGPLDFGGGDDITYWLDVDRWEPAQNDEGLQAVPSVDRLVETMRHCANNPSEVRERGIQASQLMHSKWRWENKVKEVLPILREMIPRCLI